MVEKKIKLYNTMDKLGLQMKVGLLNKQSSTITHSVLTLKMFALSLC